MKNISVSIITRPLVNNYKKLVKFLVKDLLGMFWVRYKYSGGHLGVTKSLINGLRQLGIRHNFNPYSAKRLSEVVFVLADIEALRQVIDLKKQGLVKKIIAGPNLVIRSVDFDSIVADSNIDTVIVPSEWVKLAYIEDTPELKNRIELWPAGVNEKYWQPSQGVKQKALIYYKSTDEVFLKEVIAEVKKFFVEVEIVKYGQYTARQYRQQLNESVLVIFLSRSESQGLALLEAWSMDVPTLCWNPGELNYDCKDYSVVSSCPYLTAQTGKDWLTINDLSKELKSFSRTDFSPRAWVLSNMTDKISAKEILKYAK